MLIFKGGGPASGQASSVISGARQSLSIRRCVRFAFQVEEHECFPAGVATCGRQTMFNEGRLLS